MKWKAPKLPPRAKAGEAFIANLHAGLAHIAVNAAGAAAGSDPGYLHQLRVGIRRLRTTLKAFRGLVRDRPARRFDRSLRGAQRALGAARDWDVFLASHRNRELRKGARGDADRARRRVGATIRAASFGALLRQLREWGESAPWKANDASRKDLVEFAQCALDRFRDKLVKSARGIDWRDAGPRHRVRIRVKRLRYCADCFAAAWQDRGKGPFIRRLRRLQESLGELNDIQVQRRLLKRIRRVGGAAAASAAAAAGAKLHRREKVLLEDLGRDWKGFKAARPFWRSPHGTDTD